MKSPPKKKSKPNILDYTRGASRVYRVLTRLQARLSEWNPEAETLLAKYNRTGDPRDFDAFAIHVSGELVKAREILKEGE